MVTQFNAKDMTAFGNYVLEQVNKGSKEAGPDGKLEITHADFENWKDSQSKVKKVRSKFFCWQVLPGEEDMPTSVQMTACMEGSPENEEFSKYTPAGNFFLGISPDAKALELFKEGQEYYIDIIKA